MVIWKVEGDSLHYFATKERAKKFMSAMDEEQRLHRIEVKNREHLLQELKLAAAHERS